MEGEPGHLLPRKGVEEQADYSPVDQESGEEVPLYRVVDGANSGEEQGQKLIDGQKHYIVEPGLAPSGYSLLFDPVIDGAPDTSGESGDVGEEAGVKQGEDAIENEGRD